jgi:hypothetical protein
MSLKNFGNVLDFAIAMEQDDTAFLEKLEGEVQSAEEREAIANCIRENSKAIKKLLRERQENVTEMILEPIQGLEKNQYELPEQENAGGHEGAIAQLLKREHRAQRFYEDAARCIQPVSEVATTFQRLGRQHKRRQERFETA